MPRGRGKRGQHKGQHRHFTNEEQLVADAEKARKNREWREMKGMASDEEEDAEAGKGEGAAKPDDVAEEEESGSESEEESDDDPGKPKGISHLIETQNPNRLASKTTKKVTELAEDDAKPFLTRREREEIQKQQAKAHYQKLHIAGKTDEARADLARLALIRKQREEAQKKRDQEKQQKDSEKKAAENRLLEKKNAAK
ncbi:hypothetical protein NP493_245g01020 [Ridgeia piscesae]|uniref:Casein kinase substrate phosphoprotein PP28 domain-containing protein n=1 Tax=Ridgeia piscesae TaxID=27915 RepID=A0AAD9NZ67_RIDPI|nr:hypothetical protein NP493_245g01020 [Ridgeia piscesae]